MQVTCQKMKARRGTDLILQSSYMQTKVQHYVFDFSQISNVPFPHAIETCGHFEQTWTVPPHMLHLHSLMRSAWWDWAGSQCTTPTTNRLPPPQETWTASNPHSCSPGLEPLQSLAVPLAFENTSPGGEELGVLGWGVSQKSSNNNNI